MSRRSHIEQTNPLRGLNPARVAALIEGGMRGELSALMWLYHIIEQSDPDLVALVERRTAAVCEMDWNIGIAPAEGKTEDGKRKMEEGAAENRWVTIGGRPVYIDEDGDRENPHSAKQQAAEIGKGVRAMRRAIATKSDELYAVARGDIGPVHFYYDWPGKPPKHKAGSGVAKIVAKYGEDVALKIPETIVRGKLGDPYEGGRKRDVTWGNYKAILRLDRSGAKELWLLNGFEVGGER